jgi:SAM-dependent methyltransferase
VYRLYLVASGMDADDQLDQQIEEDRQNHVTVKSLPIDRRLTQTSVPMTDMWLIDNKVVVNQELASDGTATWLVSSRPHEVAQGLGHWKTLLELTQAEPLYETGRTSDGPPDLTAQLLRSAPLIRSVASVLCVDDPSDAGRCDWYHGVWQYLRLFNMVSSPNWHADFYYTRLRDAIRLGRSRRILVSGAADYSMLAFVLSAAATTNRRTATRRFAGYDIHVLDRCPTPLAASQWYARELNADVKLHQADLTNADVTRELMPKNQPYDLIVADAFLTRFARDTSGMVLRNWSRLLKPGGTVVTTVRLHPRNVGPTDDDESVSVVRGSAGVTDAIADFHFRLRERAEGWRPVLGIDLDQLCRAARDYALRMTSNDLGGQADIVTAFNEHDFDIIEEQAEKVDGELVRTEYLRVVARKRA